MNNKMLRPFIVKLSVLGYFTLYIYWIHKYNYLVDIPS